MPHQPFLTAHVYRNLKSRSRPCGFTRSRPYQKNDNAHVEQKNSSVVRDLFGITGSTTRR